MLRFGRLAGGIIEEDNLLNKRDVRWWRPPAQPSNDQIATTQYNKGNDQIATFPKGLPVILVSNRYQHRYVVDLMNEAPLYRIGTKLPRIMAG